MPRESEFSQGTVFANSYGARKVLTWLIEGRLFDQGRLPVLTALVVIGAVVCVTHCRRDERARALLGLEVLSLVLYSGGPSLGRLVHRIPGSTGIQLNGFIVGVHLGGIVLAGVGLVTVSRVALKVVAARVPRGAWQAGGLVVVVLLVLAPAWYQLAQYDGRDGVLVARQAKAEASDGADVTRLMAEIKRLGGGRAYAGSLSNWGRQYVVGYVPMSSILLSHGVDAIGFQLRTLSLSSDPEARFDPTNQFDYKIFGVRYLLLPDTMRAPVPAAEVDRQGHNVLWRVDGDPGYLEVVDVRGAVSADRSNLGLPWPASWPSLAA